MTDVTYQAIAMIIYFVAMLAIGGWAYLRTDNFDDYMLADRDLNPWVAALSAGASDMSGWLLMGLPGTLYVSGLVEGWIAVGLTVGALANWLLVAPRLRAYTEVANNSITVPSFLDNRLHDTHRLLRWSSGLIILVYFTFYVSSGMVSGGLFFKSSFGQEYHTGMLLLAGITVFYTLFGGFMGASYTDMVQGLLMLAALIAVPVITIIDLGGVGPVVESISQVRPDALSIFAGTTFAGIVSSLAWGLGYFGQPHIIVRFMAMRTPADAKSGRRIGISWMVLTVFGALSGAFMGIAYFARHPEASLTNPETAESVFLDLSQILFHPFIAGLILAAVLAAIMSTLSSQLIVCSSALVEDLYGIFSSKKLSASKSLWLGRAGVAIVALVAGALAWNPNSSILQLVAFAWAGFGSAFGPTVLLSLYWRKLTTQGALASMITGAVVAFAWGQSPLKSVLYEMVPGFASALLVAIIVSLVTYKKNPVIDEEFDRAVELAKVK